MKFVFIAAIATGYSFAHAQGACDAPHVLDCEAVYMTDAGAYVSQTVEAQYVNENEDEPSLEQVAKALASLAQLDNGG